jgi:hypothetical protein
MAVLNNIKEQTINSLLYIHDFIKNGMVPKMKKVIFCILGTKLSNSLSYFLLKIYLNLILYCMFSVYLVDNGPEYTHEMLMYKFST